MKIFTSIVSIFLCCAGLASSNSKIDIQDIISGKFEPSCTGQIEVLSDGEHYLVLDKDNGRILKCAFSSGQIIETVVDVRSVRGERISRIDGFILSPKEDKLLLRTKTEYMNPLEYTAIYYILTIKNNLIEPLSTEGPQQSPKFSPDGNVVCFARDNNLFLIKLLFNNSESQVTKNGEIQKIRNGIPDTFSQKEFYETCSFGFSADSKMLAYVSFDESRIKDFSPPLFQTAIDKAQPYQPLFYEGRGVLYPVAGGQLVKANVHTFDIKSAVDRIIDLSIDNEFYITRICFAENKDNSLIIFTLNRSQNRLDIYSANPRSTLCNLIIRENSQTSIDPSQYTEARVFENHIILKSPKNGFNHLYLYDLNGTLHRQITNGQWNVLSFYGWDQRENTFYYSSDEPGVLKSGLFKIDSREKVTLISKKDGYNQAIFSKNFKYYLNFWSNLNTPPVITLNNKNGKELAVIEDNMQLREEISASGFLPKELFTYKAGNDSELSGWIIKPAGEIQGKQYPLVIIQYGLPAEIKVKDSWYSGLSAGSPIENILSQNGYAVACIDTRSSSPHSGSESYKLIHMGLEYGDEQDIQSASEYLGSLSFIDKSRIAVCGWGYGGHTAIMSMTGINSLIKAGIAISPITDWRFYNAVYTERLMLTPKENGKGYSQTSIMNRVDKINGRLLLIHGLDDSEVPYTNTAVLSQSLIEAEAIFDMQIYAESKSAEARKHIILRIIDFLDRNL